MQTTNGTNGKRPPLPKGKAGKVATSQAPQAPQAPQTENPATMAGAPLAILATLGAAKLREKADGGAPKGRKGSPAIAWPEAVSLAAASLSPRFALATRSLPVGRPQFGLSETIPTEPGRKMLAAQVLLDAVNGKVNGQSILPANMADGEQLSLEWVLGILAINEPTYTVTKSWQTLSKLCNAIANLSGRYVYVTREGFMYLSTKAPDDENAGDSPAGDDDSAAMAESIKEAGILAAG
jgi:hypothetical protein